MAKILIVEDDASLREALVYNLRQENYTPIAAEDAASAVLAARRDYPDLIVLDLMLPGGSGFDVCRTIRTFSAVPIIMLTAKDESVDRVLGLEIGADDYVTKPFSLRELLARIKANLRRVELDHGEGRDTVVAHGGVIVDLASRNVQAGGRTVELQPREYDLLIYLMRHPGKVLTREALLAGVWGHDFVGRRTVDVHVRRVRAALEEVGAEDPIRTVHGVGYALDP